MCSYQTKDSDSLAVHICRNVNESPFLMVTRNLMTMLVALVSLSLLWSLLDVFTGIEILPLAQVVFIYNVGIAKDDILIPLTYAAWRRFALHCVHFSCFQSVLTRTDLYSLLTKGQDELAELYIKKKKKKKDRTLRAFSHLKVSTKVQNKVHVFVTFHTFDTVS